MRRRRDGLNGPCRWTDDEQSAVGDEASCRRNLGRKEVRDPDERRISFDVCAPGRSLALGRVLDGELDF